MSNLDLKQISIFLWHDPADSGFANQLAGDLIAREYEVTNFGEKIENNEPSFTSDWQMARSDCVLFLISEFAIESPILLSDCEKTMRRKDVLVIPAYLDDQVSSKIPLVIQYIQPLLFYKDYETGFDILIKMLQRKRIGEHDKQKDINQQGRRYYGWILEHFRRYLTLTPLTFCWQITVENLIVSLAVSGLIYLIWQPIPRTNLESITASTYLWSIIILGPILETILLQALPVWVARLLGFRFYGQLLFSIVPFAALHFTRSISAGIGAGVIGGFYSAFTYVHWQSKSTWKAFWVTAFSHCLYNMALFAMLIGEF